MSNQQLKTGTTCIGVAFKDGVVLAADNRVTTYKVESDKFTKVFNLSDNIVATISGHVSPAQRAIRAMQAELKLMELKKERKVTVKEAAHLLSSMQAGLASGGGIVSVLIGGYDEKEGVSIYDLGPDGSVVDSELYYADGSGSIFVQGVLDSDFKEGMTEKEALALVERGFKASFKRDTASGGGFIAKVITQDGIKEVERKVVKSELVSA